MCTVPVFSGSSVSLVTIAYDLPRAMMLSISFFLNISHSCVISENNIMISENYILLNWVVLYSESYAYLGAVQ